MTDTPPPEVPRVTRNYRYRLNPTPSQAVAFERAMKASRRLWNACVTAQRAAMAAVRHGRKERVVATLRRQYLAKRAVGMLAAKIRRIMAEQKLDEAAARDFISREQAGKSAKYRRSLAVQAGAESGQVHMRHHWPSTSVSTLGGWGVIKHYADAAARWAQGDFGELMRKRATDTAALRWQIAKGGWQLGPVVSLSALGQACAAVACVNHRPLPKDAVPKQLSVTRDAVGHWHLTVALECPRASEARDYGPANGKVGGINPGIRLRLTVADGASPPAKPVAQVIDRPPHRMDRQDRKLARLLRQLDRQVRTNNPECFTSDGQWKKGARAKVKSKAMQAVRAQANGIQLHASEVRRDFYHKTAVRLLQGYQTLKLGNWVPADTAEKKDRKNKPGVAIRRRRTNRKAYRQAISTFTAALKDKATLSLTPRTVQVVDERDSTRTCPVCHLLTGPQDVRVQKWTCESCGHSFVREHAAAWNLAQIPAAVASTEQPVRRKRRAKSGSVSRASGTNAGVPSP